MSEKLNNKTVELLKAYSDAQLALQVADYQGLDISEAGIGIDVRIPGATCIEGWHNVDITDHDNYTIVIESKTNWSEKSLFENTIKFPKSEPDSKDAVRTFVDFIISTNTISGMLPENELVHNINGMTDEEKRNLDKVENTDEWKTWSPHIQFIKEDMRCFIGMRFSGSEYLDLVVKANEKALRPDINLQALASMASHKGK